MLTNLKSVKESKGRGQAWWDRWHLGLARYHATPSKDPSTKVGAIIIDARRRPVSSGYNGFACGIEDTDERLNNRDLKYKLVIHGEENAMHFAERDLSGCTLYTWPFMPCASCASHIIQRGIVRVVAPNNDNPRWVESFKLTREVFAEAGVELVTLDFPTSNLDLSLVCGPTEDLVEVAPHRCCGGGCAK